jgi:hypothetical protein
MSLPASFRVRPETIVHCVLKEDTMRLSRGGHKCAHGEALGQNTSQLAIAAAECVHSVIAITYKVAITCAAHVQLSAVLATMPPSPALLPTRRGPAINAAQASNCWRSTAPGAAAHLAHTQQHQQHGRPPLPQRSAAARRSACSPSQRNRRQLLVRAGGPAGGMTAGHGGGGANVRAPPLLRCLAQLHQPARSRRP